MIVDVDMLKKIEKLKDKILDLNIEKNNYLGEFKERVICALSKDEVEEKFIYPEVEKAMRKKIATKMIISRDINLAKMKKYLNLAKENNLNFKIVDGLLYSGDIGLVIAANESLKNKKENVLIKSFKDRILDSNLDEVYFLAMGKKISPKYYDIIKEKLPEMLKFYTPMSFWDKIFGSTCIIKNKLESNGGK